MSEPTYWNGEPTKAYRTTVIVGPSPVPTWWCSTLAGTVRKAVVVYYGGKLHDILDDEDGSGWAKVTEGHGSPNWPHDSLPLTSEISRCVAVESEWSRANMVDEGE